jgi:hypothetical protein
MAPRTFDIKSSCDTQLTFRSLTFATGEDGDLKMLPQGRHKSTCLWLHHRHQADPAQDQIPVQGVTSTPPRSFGIHLTTSLRSGLAPTGNLWKAVALSAWWPRMVTDRTTPPADIPPSGYQRYPTPEHRAAAWSRI